MALTKVSYSMITGAPVNVLDFGADPTGAADSTSAINAALAFSVATGKPGVVTIPPGTYKCTSTITVDVSMIRLVGQYATLSFATAAASIVAIQVTSSTTATIFNQSPSGIEGLVLVGPNTGTASVAIDFDATAPYNIAYSSFENIAIYNFYNGLTFHDNVYLVSFSGMNIRVDGGCLVDFVGLINAGERMAFVNSTFSGAQYALVCENPNSTWEFTNCSFDCGFIEIFVRGGATISCTNCHFEYLGNVLDADWNTSSNPSINFFGCRFVQRNLSASVPNFFCKTGTRLTIIGGEIDTFASTATNISMASTARLTYINVIRGTSGGTVDTLNNCSAVYIPLLNAGDNANINYNQPINGVINRSFGVTLAAGASTTVTTEAFVYGIVLIAIGATVDTVGQVKGLYLATGGNSITTVTAIANVAVTVVSANGQIVVTNNTGQSMIGNGFINAVPG
jgi:hypothetical protein